MLYYSEESKRRYTPKTLRKFGKSPEDTDVFELKLNRPNFDEIRYFIRDTGEVIKREGFYEVVYEILPLETEIVNKKLKEKKDYYYKRLLDLYESKEKGARKVITGVPVNETLLKEYERKQKALNEGNIDFFANEAEINGTTAQEEFDRAMQVADAYNVVYDSYISLMAAFRRGVGKFIELEEWMKVEWLLRQGEKLDKNTNINEIKELLNV